MWHPLRVAEDYATVDRLTGGEVETFGAPLRDQDANREMFAPLGFVPSLTPEQIDAVADPKRARQARLPTLRNAIKAGTWLIGPPELITEQLMEIQHKYPGLDVVNVGQPVGTPQAVILEQLDRFAAQVMPAFKRA